MFFGLVRRPGGVGESQLLIEVWRPSRAKKSRRHPAQKNRGPAHGRQFMSASLEGGPASDEGRDGGWRKTATPKPISKILGIYPVAQWRPLFFRHPFFR